jgi:hypothetical protein
MLQVGEKSLIIQVIKVPGIPESPPLGGFRRFFIYLST